MSSAAAQALKVHFQVSFAAVKVNIPVHFNWGNFMLERANVYNALSIKKAEVQSICDVNTFLHVSALAVQAKIDANSVYGTQAKAPVPERPPAMSFPFGIDRHLADTLQLINQGELPSHGVTWTMARNKKFDISRMNDADKREYAENLAHGKDFPWHANREKVEKNRQHRQALAVSRQLGRLADSLRSAPTNLLATSATTHVASPLVVYQRGMDAWNEYDRYLHAMQVYDREVANRNQAFNELVVVLLRNLGQGTQPTEQQILEVRNVAAQQLETMLPAPSMPMAIQRPSRDRSQLLADLVNGMTESATNLTEPQQIQPSEGYGDPDHLGKNLYWDPRMLADYDAFMNSFSSFVGRVNFDRSMEQRQVSSVPLPLMGVHRGYEFDSCYVSSPVVIEDPIAIGTLMLHQPYVYNNSVDNLQVFKSAEIRGITQLRNGVREIYTSMTTEPKVNMRVEPENRAPPSTAASRTARSESTSASETPPVSVVGRKKKKKTKAVSKTAKPGNSPSE